MIPNPPPALLMFGLEMYEPMVRKRKVSVRKKKRSMRVTFARSEARLDGLEDQDWDWD